MNGTRSMKRRPKRGARGLRKSPRSSAVTGLSKSSRHEAGIRPILRRSEPLIGPLGDGDWMFNGLGSKGSLYAPGTARQLADWLVENREPDPELDFRVFRGKSRANDPV